MRQKDFYGTKGRGFLLENGKDCLLWPGAGFVAS